MRPSPFTASPAVHPAGILAITLAALAFWMSATGIQAQTSTPVSEIIYDNSAGDNPQFFPTLLEYGDEINLKAPPAGAAWILTDLYIEFFGDIVPEGDEKGRIRVYRNDGPGKYSAPSTVLYDSGEFPLEKGFQTKVVSGLGITVPNKLTWTIQFSGVRGVNGDQAGLLLRPTPTIGNSFKDFWIRNPNGWALSQILPANPNLPADPVTNPDPVENFGCRFLGINNATPPPPPPPPPPPAVPKLNVRRDGDKMVLEWTGDARLQSTDSVPGTFRDVPGAASPYTTAYSQGTLKFWRLISGVPPQLLLNIRRADQNLVLEWTGTAKLQASDSATGGYADVPGAVSPFSVPLSSGSLKFWRLAN